MTKKFPAGKAPVNKDAAAGTSVGNAVVKGVKSGYKYAKKGAKWVKKNPGKTAALAALTVGGTPLATLGAVDLYQKYKKMQHYNKPQSRHAVSPIRAAKGFYRVKK